MPLYEYQCSSCEVIFECFETMSENAESGDPNCPKCDPDASGAPTCFKYLGNCRPAFNLKGPEGRGFHRPGWQ